MAVRPPLVNLNGYAAMLPAGDTLPGTLAMRQRQTLSGTVGQQTFTVAGGYGLINNVPLLDVYINGVYVTEYTATDGSTFTLTEGLDSASDEVVVVPLVLNALSAAVRAEVAPTSMSFGAFSTTPYRTNAPSALVLMNDSLTSDAGQFTRYSEATPGTYSVGSGVLRITHSSGALNDIIVQTSQPLAMPQAWVEAAINVTNTGATGYDNGGVGLVKDANNFVVTNMDRVNSTLRLQVKIGGVNNFLGEIGMSWGASFKLAMSLVGNSACVWVDTGSGWVCRLIQVIKSYYDFMVAGNTNGWYPGVSLASGGGTSVWEFSSFRFARFGGVGLRDITVVSNQDGTPYVVGGNTVYFTATVSDPRGTDVASCYLGVFSLNVITGAYAQTAVILNSRDGKVFGDQAGHLIRLNDGSFRILMGSWGNGFGGVIQTYTGTSTQNLLSGSYTLALSQITLPGQTGAKPGAYDAFAAYDSANARWLIAYTLTNDTAFSGNPFYAALCYTTDWSTFTLIAKDSANNGYEGTKLLLNNGNFYVLAGGPAGSGNSSRVYNANLSYLGSLSVIFQGGADTQPHPMIVPVGDKQYLLTFDNTRFNNYAFTWGAFQIAQANRYVS